MSARSADRAGPCGPAGERGVVLLVALVVLGLLTVVVLGALRTAMLEERSTANAQHAALAMQAAEAGLREGERVLAQPSLPSFDGSVPGLYPPVSETTPPPRVDWDAPRATIEYGGMRSAGGPAGAVNVRYYIEALAPVVAPGRSLAADTAPDESRFFRITARATSGGASVVLQSTFER